MKLRVCSADSADASSLLGYEASLNKVLPNAVDLRPFMNGHPAEKDFDAIYTGRLLDMKEPPGTTSYLMLDYYGKRGFGGGAEIEYNRKDSYGKTELIHDTFKRCLRKAFPNHYHDMIAICLKPYHEFGYPLMVKDWWEED